ncbi:MAG TPA: lipid-binding protein, partial [Adhaeribacter sp.]|nr:lipid-binding protein [Adhaeribacter sp.]
MHKIFRNSLMIVSFISAGFLTSCDKDDDYEFEKTAVSEMAGEWYVKFEADNGSGVFTDPAGDGRSTFNVNTTACERRWQASPQGYRKIMTSNTADDNNNQMWIGDMFGNPRAINFGSANTRGTFWSFMVRTNVDLGAMTFSADDKNIGIVSALPQIDSTFAATPPG